MLPVRSGLVLERACLKSFPFHSFRSEGEGCWPVKGQAPVRSVTRQPHMGSHVAPLLSCSLQRVVLELSGDGVADRAPGCAEGPEPHSGAGAATRVHSRALQGVSPGHHPDRQPAEVSGAGAGVGPPPGSSLGSVAGESSTSLVPLGTRSLSLLAFRLHKPNTQ